MIELSAWKTAFGTSQLTHALAKMEAAEKQLAEARGQVAVLREAALSVIPRCPCCGTTGISVHAADCTYADDCPAENEARVRLLGQLQRVLSDTQAAAEAHDAADAQAAAAAHDRAVVVEKKIAALEDLLAKEISIPATSAHDLRIRGQAFREGQERMLERCIRSVHRGGYGYPPGLASGAMADGYDRGVSDKTEAIRALAPEPLPENVPRGQSVSGKSND